MKNLSIAMWTDYKPNHKDKIPGDRHEIHFNVWNIEEHHAIDIGIMLPKALFENANSLYIFLPFDGELEDLCDKLIQNDHKLLKSIFNSFFSVRPCPNSHRCCYAELDESLTFCLNSSKLDKIKSVKPSGCIYKIIPGQHKKCKELAKNYYLRFRASGEQLKSCYFNSTKESSSFQNFTDSIHFLDFRYNARRILPEAVVEEILNNNQICLDLIQFFYICPASYRIELTKKELSNMRCLEYSIWKDYYRELECLGSGLVNCFFYQSRLVIFQEVNDEPTFFSYSRAA